MAYIIFTYSKLSLLHNPTHTLQPSGTFTKVGKKSRTFENKPYSDLEARLRGLKYSTKVIDERSSSSILRKTISETQTGIKCTTF